MILFAGTDWWVTWRNDVWTLDLAATPPLWQQVVVSGEKPAVRLGHSGVYHPPSDSLLVFGGSANGPGDAMPTNDVWALSLTSKQWNRIETSGGPPSPRSGGSAVYDQQRDRMIAFGGSTNIDTWALDLGTIAGGTATWTPLQQIGGWSSVRSSGTNQR